MEEGGRTPFGFNYLNIGFYRGKGERRTPLEFDSLVIGLCKGEGGRTPLGFDYLNIGFYRGEEGERGGRARAGEEERRI